LTVSISFPLTLFAAVLEGMQKFSRLQITGIAGALVRTGLIVVALTNGRGLLTIAIISLAVNLFTYLSFAQMAIQVLPVRLRLKAVEPAALRKMGSYGIFSFAILAAEKLRFQSDAVVIGVFLSSTAITYFSIGAKLVEYTSYGVRSMSQLVVPISAHFYAMSDLDHLRRILIAGSRASALIIFPISLILALDGKPIIETWVGQAYVRSYPVLILLLIPRTIYLAQSTSIRILLGMGKHRALGIVLFLEGVANLLLSVVLARPLGIVGVALGTTIPLLCTSLLFLPSHVCRLLNVPLGKFLQDSYGMALALCAPLLAILLLLKHQFPAHTGLALLGQSGALAILYYGSWAAIVWKRRERNVKSWESLLSQALEPR
jgi:O-antigen/teichoic acid export membrane protein